MQIELYLQHHLPEGGNFLGITGDSWEILPQNFSDSTIGDSTHLQNGSNLQILHWLAGDAVLIARVSTIIPC